jgi:hypothetical protein
VAEWDLGVGGEDGVLDPGTGPAGPGFDRVFALASAMNRACVFLNMFSLFRIGLFQFVSAYFLSHITIQFIGQHYLFYQPNRF